jgi:hypothetical protein
MIVSNFIPAVPSPVQGVDLSRRSLKTGQDDQVSHDFSNLLGRADLPDSSGPVPSDVAPRRTESSFGRSGISPKSGPREASAGAASAAQVGSVMSDRGNAQVSASTTALSSLGDFAPLPRDPRLDDPSEIAMEAAALALASAVLQKPQQVVVPPVLTDEEGSSLQGEQGGNGFTTGNEFGDSTLGASVLAGPVLFPVLAAPIGGLPVEVVSKVSHGQHASQSVDLSAGGGNQIVVNPVFVAEIRGSDVPQSDGFTVKAPVVEALAALSLTQQPISSTDSQVPTGTALPSFGSLARGDSAVPAVILKETVRPSVVVTATPSQVMAVLSAGEALLSGAPSQTLVGDLVQIVSTPQNAPQPAPDQGKTDTFDFITSGLSTLSSDPTSLNTPSSSGDEALLQAALPESPAQAYFAARGNVVSDDASLPTDLTAGGVNGTTEEAPLVSVFAPETDGRSMDNSGKDSQSGAFVAPQAEEGGGLSAGRERDLRINDSRVLAASPKADDKVGTLGAEESGVHRAVEPTFLRPTDVSTGIEIPLEDAASASLTGSAVPLSFGSQHPGTAPTAVQEASMRPTVLPPVQTRFSDVFNVVQRALERARSENPSHLAVEVTLEDGSSFGLEVRMNSAGLQASFRSESQSLLKALETGWSGFVSRDAADYKVASAAFQGRSGSGDFAENKSGGGERHEQFQDNSAAALLRGRNSSQARQGVESRNQQTPRGQEMSKGMALYA